jgi:hypothetical protein
MGKVIIPENGEKGPRRSYRGQDGTATKSVDNRDLNSDSTFFGKGNMWKGRRAIGDLTGTHEIVFADKLKHHWSSIDLYLPTKRRNPQSRMRTHGSHGFFNENLAFVLPKLQVNVYDATTTRANVSNGHVPDMDISEVGVLGFGPGEAVGFARASLSDSEGRVSIPSPWISSALVWRKLRGSTWRPPNNICTACSGPEPNDYARKSYHVLTRPIGICICTDWGERNL